MASRIFERLNAVVDRCYQTHPAATAFGGFWFVAALFLMIVTTVQGDWDEAWVRYNPEYVDNEEMTELSLACFQVGFALSHALLCRVINFMLCKMHRRHYPGWDGGWGGSYEQESMVVVWLLVVILFIIGL